MKTKTFIIGSSYFFSQYPDYQSHDIDKLILVDNLPVPILNMKKDHEDVFFMKRSSKEQLLKETLECDTPMRVGKFLIPEVCQELGVTIQDLEILRPQFDKLDDKHLYEKFIYECYKQNNNFVLTDTQQFFAYHLYQYSRSGKEQAIVGSVAWFSQFPDFKVHDVDYLVVRGKLWTSRYDEELKYDYHYVPDKSKIELIQDLQHMTRYEDYRAASFIHPEFIRRFSITIEDIKQLSKQLDKLKKSRPYLHKIYQYYLENNKLELTEEQLKEVYQIYKKKSA